MVSAHYPSDVVAGLALGAWFSFMTAIVYSRYGLLFKTDENGWPIPRLPILRK
jgi:undecaprenyl-diphosphatase